MQNYLKTAIINENGLNNFLKGSCSAINFHDQKKVFQIILKSNPQGQNNCLNFQFSNDNFLKLSFNINKSDIVEETENCLSFIKKDERQILVFTEVVDVEILEEENDIPQKAEHFGIGMESKACQTKREQWEFLLGLLRETKSKNLSEFKMRIHPDLFQVINAKVGPFWPKICIDILESETYR